VTRRSREREREREEIYGVNVEVRTLPHNDTSVAIAARLRLGQFD
jgi:hypothetical protein